MKLDNCAHVLQECYRVLDNEGQTDAQSDTI